ncbi:major capsid protein [Novosphingobium album (ex Liu et al. 2023)]|uniref:Major capsid protein n=1 Tax=Novosphingobium album (ex Liu et al. 2023) TaxID=3031130 RepID=A0ABT5WPB2_9SPHN|nr:major capsid protein [Novosphingobium album (ex Liu et al. 2023)]MDE8651891.1 major capsid protein [Novosphingobium album (ex Liu et al. 2023)]
MLKKVALVSVLMIASTGSALAQAAATGPDYSSLTSAISVESTVTAILSVGALVIGISLAVMGVRKVISLVRGA